MTSALDMEINEALELGASLKLTYSSHAESTHWDINGEPTAIYIVKA